VTHDVLRVRARDRRSAAVVVSAAVLALVMVPLFIGTRYDSFPLSTFPMFAGSKPDVAPVSTVVATSDEGTSRLSSELIGGTDEPMLAAETVVRAIRRGDAEALCAEVARRAAGGEHRESTLEVVTESYDTIAWFDGARAPVARTVHARCEVEP
jgi:hypothetical protein